MKLPLRRRLVGAAVVLVGLVVATPAFAHSVLIATEPRGGAVVDDPPGQVLLRFNEPVETALGSIRVFDGSGERVDLEEIMRPSPPEVAVALEDDLPNGTYTVAWRVISADSDPINGAFVFHIGEPGAEPAGISGEFLTGTPTLTSAAFTAGRFFEFALLLLCAGGMAALAYPLRSADSRVHGRLLGVLAVAAAAFSVVALLGIPLQGAAAAGSALRDAFTWDVVSAISGTRFGIVKLIQAGLGLALLASVLYARRSAGGARRTGIGVGLVFGAALAFTPTFAGHASTAGTLAIVADILHVVAASLWVGGLAFVVLGLWFALEQRWPLATRSVPRFSTVAVGSVAILIVAGSVNGYFQVGSWSALWETRYGLLLLAKIGLIVPLLGLGAYNNRYAVPRLRRGVAEPRERRRFLQAAGVELVIMAAIVAVTAVLVNSAQPAAGAHATGDGEMATATLDFGDFEAELTVDPAMAGRNEIMVVLMPMEGGEPVEPEEVTLSASLPAQEIGPLVFEAERAPEGEVDDAMMEEGAVVYVVEEADLGLAGDWELRLEIRLDEFDLLTETTMITIEER